MRYLILFAASAFLPAASCAAENLPRKIKPVMVWTGTGSNPTKESFDRCSSQKEWEVIWHKHQSGEQQSVADCPTVDFDSYMVIAIFHGESLKNLGVQVFGVIEENHCIRVQYRPPTWQTGFNIEAATSDERRDRNEKSEGNNEHKYDPQSYAFIILPKSRKPIVFDVDARELLNAPPVWKEAATLPATDTK